MSYLFRWASFCWLFVSEGHQLFPVSARLCSWGNEIFTVYAECLHPIPSLCSPYLPIIIGIHLKSLNRKACLYAHNLARPTRSVSSPPPLQLLASQRPPYYLLLGLRVASGARDTSWVLLICLHRILQSAETSSSRVTGKYWLIGTFRLLYHQWPNIRLGATILYD